ncbi:NUDIX hydrolase [Streptomyces sp. CC224B]|uniref:NUDIX hydrolase n=1 Tax=Streptomyces sp. CC224B TaxID=3044571 RepID=UPI0024A8DB5F|nr:NUDIX hydrolase [Streptomyces sp. CC224B]
MTEPPVAAAVVVQAGRLLLIRRRVPEGDLVWQLPAGKVEDGESAEQTAVRETLEETGLVVEPIKLLGERVHPKTGRLVSYTAVRVLDGEARVADAEELDAIAWIARAEIAEYVPYGLFEPVQEYLDGVLSG